MRSLPIMNARNAIPPRLRWRDRFLEIARQVEGVDSLPPAPLAGLRMRARMAGARGARALANRLPVAKVTGFQAG